jgi:hypothetical protein
MFLRRNEMPRIRGWDVSAYHAEKELSNGDIFAVEFTTASSAGSWSEPPESDTSEPTFYIEGKQVDEKPAEISDEELQSMMENAQDITATFDFGDADMGEG